MPSWRRRVSPGRRACHRTSGERPVVCSGHTERRPRWVRVDVCLTRRHRRAFATRRDDRRRRRRRGARGGRRRFRWRGCSSGGSSSSGSSLWAHRSLWSARASSRSCARCLWRSATRTVRQVVRCVVLATATDPVAATKNKIAMNQTACKRFIRASPSVRRPVPRSVVIGARVAPVLESRRRMAGPKCAERLPFVRAGRPVAVHRSS